MRPFFKDILIGSIAALVLSVIFHLTLQQFIIQQISMIPTLVEGQRIFISKTAYLFHSPDRGDIIVFKTSQNPSEIPLIKRVIGLPGETIEIRSGTVYVNNSPLNEPYIKDLPHYVLKPLTIENENYFVLGDNRNASKDSHEGWTVAEPNIVGKAWVSIWPPKTVGLFTDYAYAHEK